MKKINNKRIKKEASERNQTDSNREWKDNGADSQNW
jgi:hypothetical protein